MLVLQQYCTTLDSTVQHKILQVNMFVSIYYYFYLLQPNIPLNRTVT